MDVCERCKLRMTKTLKEWEQITKVIEDHSPFPEASVGERLCFYPKDKCPQWLADRAGTIPDSDNCPHMDYHEVTNRKLVVSWEQYNLIKDKNPGDFIEIQEEEEEYYGSSDEEEELEESKIEQEQDRNVVTSKEERNTIVSQSKNLEESKTFNEEHFRSFNDFSPRKMSCSDTIKQKFDNRTKKIRQLSSSSDSWNTVGSDLDYRQRREKSFKYIKKIRRNTLRNTDPDFKAQLGMFHFITNISLQICVIFKKSVTYIWLCYWYYLLTSFYSQSVRWTITRTRKW